MTTPTSPLVRFLRWLGKVQFTMILLIAGAAVMIAGTVIESRAGVEVAQSTVYRAWWFDLYLLLIVVNLVVAVVNRVPIQRHQWAFVLTHAAIVTLMFGAWVSRTFGYEGRVAVFEGSTENRLHLDSTELRWQWGSGQELTATLGRNHGLAGQLVAEASVESPELRIAEHIPHGVYQQDIFAGNETDSPGISVHLNGHNLNVHEWLIGESRSLRRKDVGPVEIELVVARTPEFLLRHLPARDAAGVTVELQPAAGGAPVRIELPRQLGHEIDLGNGVRAKVVKYLHHARVEAGGLVDNPKAPVNPAVVVEIRDDTRTESLTLFSEFPQFNMTTGRDEQHPLIAESKLTAATVGSKPLVTLLVDAATEQLYVQLSAAQGRGEAHAFERGKSVVIGNLGIDLLVHDYLPHATLITRVVPVPSRANGQAWLRLVARTGAGESSEWLRFGSSRKLAAGGRQLVASWQSAVRELPFRLALDEFEIDYHPGSRRPAQYASHVRILDPDGSEQAAVVSMNRPLDHMGFRIFQSSYRLGGMGRPDQTVLTVSRDPGVAIVYPSFILLILGVGWYLVGSGRRARATDARTETTTTPTTVPGAPQLQRTPPSGAIAHS